MMCPQSRWHCRSLYSTTKPKKVTCRRSAGARGCAQPGRRRDVGTPCATADPSDPEEIQSAQALGSLGTQACGQQGPGLLEVCRVEALREPVVDGGHQPVRGA